MTRHLIIFGSVCLSFWFVFNCDVNTKVRELSQLNCPNNGCSLSSVDDLYIPFIKTTRPKNTAAERQGSLYHIVGRKIKDPGTKVLFYERALEDYPLDEELIYDYAKALITEGSSFKLALDNLNVILKTNPELLSAQIWKSIALLELNRCEDLSLFIQSNKEAQRAYSFLINYFCLNIVLCEYKTEQWGTNGEIEVVPDIDRLVNDMSALKKTVNMIVEEREKIKGFSWKALANENLNSLITKHRKDLNYRENLKLIESTLSIDKVDCR